MNIMLRAALLLLAVKTAFGLDKAKVLFPDDSEEAVDEFTYEHFQVSDKPLAKGAPKIQFRIDATDVPCVNKTMFFCEEVSNQAYPIKYVESVLAKTDAQTYENYFNKTVSTESVGLRISTDGPANLCKSYKRLIYPQLAMNIDHDWRFVINQPSYQQAVHVEICQKRRSQCLFNDSFSNVYASFCAQKFMTVQLLSLGEDGQIESYNYKFPSHCECQLHLKRSDAIGGRNRRF